MLTDVRQTFATTFWCGLTFLNVSLFICLPQYPSQQLAAGSEVLILIN